MLTREELVAVMPRAAAAAMDFTPPLDAAMRRFEIDRPARCAAFLAQLAHESGELRQWTENLNYSWQALRKVFPKYFPTDAAAQAYHRQPEKIANRVYGGRMGNGGEASGDGWRYRGRGPIQLTGKDNYRACGQAIGVDLVNRPELLETPEVGCLAAAWFWSSRGLNPLADAGKFLTITRRINGGTHGLDERMRYWEQARAVFGVAAPAELERLRPRRKPKAAPKRKPAPKPTRKRAARAKAGARARPAQTARKAKKAPAKRRSAPRRKATVKQRGRASKRRTAARARPPSRGR
jgi:putative chitinase